MIENGKYTVIKRLSQDRIMLTAAMRRPAEHYQRIALKFSFFDKQKCSTKRCSKICKDYQHKGQIKALKIKL